LAWGDVDDPRIAVIDCVAADPAPVIALMGSADVETIAHAAKQDLGLLAARFGTRARCLWDTQIAAAFVGIGEQVGYAKLVSRMAKVALDKGAQYTQWLERPLGAGQLRYAINDVRYLPLIWRELRAELDENGRLAWVEEESQRLARSVAYVTPDEEAYCDLRGWRSLSPEGMGALRELAAWRQRTARESNKPLSWLLPDRAAVDICRLGPETTRDLRRVRGVGDGTVRRYGRAILEAVHKGAAAPLAKTRRKDRTSLSARGQVWAGVVAHLVQSRCAEAGIAPRFVGTRADAERFVAWFESGDPTEPPDIPLLHGWRRELAGEAALSWLEGRTALAVTAKGPASLHLVEQSTSSDDPAEKK
jgi:ribonuclease D